MITQTRWDCYLRDFHAPEPHRPYVVTDGHFRVFFRLKENALHYLDIQNTKESK